MASSHYKVTLLVLACDHPSLSFFIINSLLASPPQLLIFSSSAFSSSLSVCLKSIEMMPPEQETIATTGTATSIQPANIPAANWSENALVHAEPSGTSTSSLSINVSTCFEDQMPDQLQDQANTHRFSILHQSLRPITLKVYKHGQLPAQITKILVMFHLSILHKFSTRQLIDACINEYS